MNSRFIKFLVLLAGIGGGLSSRLRSNPSHAARQEQDHASKEPPRVGFKGWLFRIGAVGALLALGGFLVMVSGVIPLKASAGHWAVTQWFLQFSKTRSIATHTIGVKIPALDDPGMVLKGAGHYELGCAPCHGNPNRSPPRVAQHMLPPPPQLKYISAKYNAAELFYIVKHGLKFTGMPAWPARHRDDEVWGVVAFLRQLPHMEAEEYQRLARGEERPSGTGDLGELQPPQKMPQAVFESCGRCHGYDGQGRGAGAFPVLAQQNREYLLDSLQTYARGERHSGIMQPIAAGLSGPVMGELASYYARLPARRSPSSSGTQAEVIERGRAIATHGIPSRRVPACIECHGPRPGPRNPNYPVLAGQSADYLVLQLELFRDGHRGGGAYSHLMHYVAGYLTAEQMRDVASYYESLPGEGGER